MDNEAAEKLLEKMELESKERRERHNEMMKEIALLRRDFDKMFQSIDPIKNRLYEVHAQGDWLSQPHRSALTGCADKDG